MLKLLRARPNLQCAEAELEAAKEMTAVQIVWIRTQCCRAIHYVVKAVQPCGCLVATERVWNVEVAC